ncbi:hypothetical protein CYLTODRAFT_490778 [Cylindrobasidium torrendii FP15055 ss-10]|uniref:NYN domain-containing protein n=1 Tax=Cylindrobasidium torrendii FP15055 ss-10 TaxID=1314674 RepID=A0A0D7B9U9_9AGAR|nr:hypothetical protein CYLTODRAFT_490778 [Cylindrobasidium torrendii FP15055 ss-10]
MAKAGKVTKIASRRVGIFWDYESCPAPPGAYGDEIVRNIRQISGEPTLFNVYIDSVEHVGLNDFCHELQVSGVNMVLTPRGRGQAAIMNADSLLFALAGIPGETVIVFVAADRAFAYAASKLRVLGYHVTVIAPSGAREARLLASNALKAYNWVDVVCGPSSSVPDPGPTKETSTTSSSGCIQAGSESPVGKTAAPQLGDCIPLWDLLPPASIGEASIRPPDVSQLSL